MPHSNIWAHSSGLQPIPSYSAVTNVLHNALISQHFCYYQEAPWECLLLPLFPSGVLLTVSMRKAGTMFTGLSTNSSAQYSVAHRVDPQQVNELFLLVEKIMQRTFHLISVSRIQLHIILLPMRQSELTSIILREWFKRSSHRDFQGFFCHLHCFI